MMPQLLGALAQRGFLVPAPSSFVRPVITALELTGAMLMIARRLPHRERFAFRAALLAIGIAVFVFVQTCLFIDAPGAPNEHVPYPGLFLFFAGILVASVFCVRWLYDTSPWIALFCCTAGYTIQNIASSLEGLMSFSLLHAGSVTMEQTASPVFCAALALISVIAVYGTSYLVFVRKLEGARLTSVEDRAMLGAVFAVILVVIGFDLLVKYIELAGLPWLVSVLLHLVHGTICVLVLYIEYENLYSVKLEMDGAVLQRMLSDERRQYEISRENIEAINVKLHDIRHQIHHLGEQQGSVDKEFLGSLEDAVDIYDAQVSTGNDALDTIVTEKNLICKNHGIELTCLADGRSLDFVPASTLYSLFGNALDNAIEAAASVADPDRRIVSMSVRDAGRMVSVHVENYFDGNLAFDREGLPITHKEDHNIHGFGMKSMRDIARGLGGTMACHAVDGVFSLDIVIPRP